ncbi:GNAT family N-acetyltransferase [Microbacterium aurantiacum]|uniref:GNAT family N-acetyltransferase n=1 Tax=Microbacterium aurantiacum TaxID=162393 RepID=UPI000C80BB0A|nr:GNAT family N-acetyltransferase [Microbacterium aurantiacum]
MTTTTTLTITPLTVPATLDAADAADFVAYGELSRQICDEEVGLPDLSPNAGQLLLGWLDDTDSVNRGFVARREGVTVGMVTTSYPQEAGARTVEIDILVPREFWGQGVEGALLSLAESEARARGRDILQTWTLHRPAESDRTLTPKTGWGSVPATRLSDLFEANAFSFEQVERNSAFDLHGDTAAVQNALAAAQAAAGAAYREFSWTLPTPPELRAGYAAALSRLSTDAPTGELEIDPEHWDEDRVVRRDRRLTGAGQTVSVSAVEHVPSGTIVAYNELLVGADRSTTTHQLGTLVLKEHRGHRLGTIVKCANLLRWRDFAPESPTVSTFNAEENRPMLDINEAIGFVPVSYAGAWQKKL